MYLFLSVHVHIHVCLYNNVTSACAFSLVVAHDLLEDRRIDHVNSTSIPRQMTFMGLFLSLSIPPKIPHYLDSILPLPVQL